MPKSILLTLTFIALSISSLAQSKHCIVNNYQTYVTIEGKKVIRQVECELQINNGIGTKYAEINIPYSENNKISNIEAHIENGKGEFIRKLKRKDITNSNTFHRSTFHTDYKVASFSLIHNRYPYIIKYSYITECDNYISLINWSPFNQGSLFVKNARLTLRVPRGYKFRSNITHIKAASFSSNETNDTYKWQISNIESTKRQNYGPPTESLNPRVEIIPSDFFYGIKGKSDSWQSYGNWLHLLCKGLDELTENEKIKVHALTDTIEADREKIKVLYNYLQSTTRYINVSLELGGLIPHPASYVCNNKYGDCKALTNFMKAMLKEVGIESICADVYAGHNPQKINIEYPSQQFNHVILCVPQENDSIWLECTSSIAPIDYLGAFTHNRKVLLIEKDKSKLVTTPGLSPNQSAENYYSELKIDATGNANVRVESILKGPAFDYFEGFKDAIPKDRHADIVDEIGFLRNLDIETIDFARPEKDSAYIKVDIIAKLPNTAEKMGNRLLIKPIKAYGFNLEEPDLRTQEVLINYPIVKNDSIRISLPQNIVKVAGINEVDINSPYGQYSKKYWIDGNQLIITRKVQIYTAQYTLDEYKSFYDFTRQINAQENKKTLITY